MQEGMFFAKYSMLPGQTGLADNGMLALSAHELGYRHLVNDRRDLPYVGRRASARLAPGAGFVDQRPVLSLRRGGGGACGVGVGHDARDDDGAVWRTTALESLASVGARRVARVVCASVSARRAIVAGMDGLRLADLRAGTQFCFYTESQLPRNHQPAAISVVGRNSSGPRRDDESLDADRPIELTFAPGLCRGCVHHGLAARRSPTRVGDGWDTIARDHRGGRPRRVAGLGHPALTLYLEPGLSEHHPRDGL
jgi:hypothetical protein